MQRNEWKKYIILKTLVIVEGDNKNRGWIDANIFGTIKLKK